MGYVGTVKSGGLPSVMKFGYCREVVTYTTVPDRDEPMIAYAKYPSILEHEDDIARRIFSEYVDGKGVQLIAEYVRGLHQRGAAEWGQSRSHDARGTG
jgi:hypothetical protein